MGRSPRVLLIRRAWQNAALRRLCLAKAGFRLAELAAWIALTAYAYDAGGVREASAVVVAQLLPASVFALTVGGLIRRHGAGQVLRWGLLVQSVAMAAAALFLREGVNIGGFAAVIVAATAVTTTRPAHAVLTPSMVEGPEELTAANVFAGLLVACAGLVGPAVAAVLMTALGSWAVFAVMAGVALLAAAAVWRLPTANVAREDDPGPLVDDVRAIAAARGPRVMVLAIAAYFVVIGALDVFAVVVAVEILGRAEAYAGYLTTAVGVGSLVAGSVAIALIGRRWIAPWIVISGLAIGAALVAVSLVGSNVPMMLLVLVAFGLATTIYELTAQMLLQRVSRLDLVGRIFALVEALQMAMIGLGAAMVPLAVELFGSKGAPAAFGGFFAFVVVGLAARIVVIDRHARVPITEMAALRATPLFGALPGAALETVAREARRIDAAAGSVVVRQGDPGMEYFAVISGDLDVSIDGAHRRSLRRGDAFGEVALIHDVPRSATIRAITDATLLAVDRQPFLTAVTGHGATRDRASSIATAHLDRD